jgi:uncharacterized DUF497 family protein
MSESIFEWDERKNAQNRRKYGVSFEVAQRVFLDTRRVLARDTSHSAAEQRWYCMGRVDGGVLTVRYTMRERRIRIIGAGYWRKGRKAYEQANQIHG